MFRQFSDGRVHHRVVSASAMARALRVRLREAMPRSTIYVGCSRIGAPRDRSTRWAAWTIKTVVNACSAERGVIEMTRGYACQAASYSIPSPNLHIGQSRFRSQCQLQDRCQRQFPGIACDKNRDRSVRANLKPTKEAEVVRLIDPPESVSK